MLRFLMILVIGAAIFYFGSTVKLGSRTFFGHIQAVWSTDEAKDMRKGIEEKAGPAVDKVKRGVKAGIEAAAGDEDARASHDGGPIDGGASDGGATALETPAPVRP